MLSDYQTGSLYRRLDDVVKPLFNRLEEITERDFAFNSVRNQVRAASDALRPDFNWDGVQGPDIIDKLKDCSKTYLLAAGISFSEDDLYKSYMEQILGDNTAAAKDAVRRGDIDDLAKLFKDAYVNYNFAAKLRTVTDKISLLTSEQMQAFGKAAAERIGATDHMKILGNLQIYIAELMRKKENPLYS